MPIPGKRTLKARSVISIFFGMMSLFSLAYTPSPKAAVRSGCAWYSGIKYYTDATLTTQCGFRTYWCDGTESQAGCETEYAKVLTCTCRE